MTSLEQSSELIAKRKQAGFKWNTSTILIECRILARYLFLATQSYLYVDGQLVLETGGFRIREKGIGEFLDSQGHRHQIEYEGGGLFLTWVPCSISIDGDLVYKGACPIRGLYKAVIATGFWVIVLLASVSFITSFFHWLR